MANEPRYPTSTADVGGAPFRAPARVLAEAIRNRKLGALEALELTVKFLKDPR